MSYSRIESEPQKNGWSFTLANWVSNVLNPPLISVLGIFLMAAFLGTPDAWRWAALFVILVVIVPTLYVYLLLKRGKIETFHIPNRQNRKGVYLVIILSNVVGVIVMLVLGAPFLLLAFGIMGVMQSTLLFLINMYWKISGHTTAISGLSVFIVAALGWSMYPVLMIVPLVAWARIRTHSHSFWQTIAGVMTGAFFILMTWFVLTSIIKPDL
jgi:MFS family permease